MPTITQTNLFRWKGFQPEQVPLTVGPGHGGVRGDRLFAFAKNIKQPHDWGKEVSWAKKMHFHVCMNTPELAAEKPPLDADGLPDFVAIEALRSKLGKPGMVMVSTGGKFRMTDDRKTHWVSFLNLASVRHFEYYLGQPFDPRRLRMNVWFDGHPPWDELRLDGGYPGQRTLLVNRQYRGVVRDVLTRCGAIQANPDTGRRDTFNYWKALKEYQDARGYVTPPKEDKPRAELPVMGVLVEMLDPCVLEPGMNLQFET